MELFLPISLGYINHWELEEGIKELIANARDKVGHKREDLIFAPTKTEDGFNLCIGNKTDGDKLETKHLVLGVSEHRNSTEAIGQFGEGLKLAMVTILRAGRQEELLIVNHDELWRVSVRKHPQMGDVEVPFIQIEPCEPSNRVTFHIENLTKEEMAGILSMMWESVEKTDGLENDEIAIYRSDSNNNLFVGGIAMGELRHGFAVNTVPYGIEVNRDRKMPNSLEEVEERLRKLVADCFEQGPIYAQLKDRSKYDLIVDIEQMFNIFEDVGYVYQIQAEYNAGELDEETFKKRRKYASVARWLDRELMMADLSRETKATTLEEMAERGVYAHTNWYKMGQIKKQIPEAICVNDDLILRMRRLMSDGVEEAGILEKLLTAKIQFKAAGTVYSELHEKLYALLSDLMPAGDAAEKTNSLLQDFKDNLM